MPMKPSETEEEYFARMEYEKLKRIQEESQRKLAAEQLANAKELHYMKCPKCGMNLVEIDYKKIKVDKCTACEGIWLDAGELEMVAKMDKGGLDKLFGVFKREE
ncbi:MAG: zf-TFIIB domain-containing protein [Deltaproteobacteria bacterium]|nr:zf-TFIIB domain-containing protein [Deltaproteobacteria bacterium]